MNQKIKELAKQAGFLDLYTNELMSPFREDADISGLLDKFAELIVKTCASITIDTDLEDVEGGDNDVLWAAANQIKQHFGVEE